MLANETCGGFRQEWRSEQPASRREFHHQRIDKARPIIALMDDKAFLGSRPPDEQRSQRRDVLRVACNDRIAEDATESQRASLAMFIAALPFSHALAIL